MTFLTLLRDTLRMLIKAQMHPIPSDAVNTFSRQSCPHHIKL